jgi:hypothetical protein
MRGNKSARALVLQSGECASRRQASSRRGMSLSHHADVNATPVMPCARRHAVAQLPRWAGVRARCARPNTEMAAGETDMSKAFAGVDAAHWLIDRIWMLALAGPCLLIAPVVRALPIFARQTGQSRMACHAGGQSPVWTFEPLLLSWRRFLQRLRQQLVPLRISKRGPCRLWLNHLGRKNASIQLCTLHGCLLPD